MCVKGLLLSGHKDYCKEIKNNVNEYMQELVNVVVQVIRRTILKLFLIEWLRILKNNVATLNFVQVS